MQPAPFASVLKSGSCAIRGCEPCQVGDQAALSGLSGVPQGCLFGADGAVNVCKGISTERCMVLSDVSRVNTARMRKTKVYRCAFLFLKEV